MKLTEEQLDLIDRYLEQRNLIFLDFKIEVKDHFASEIEDILIGNMLNFEEAFALVEKKWDSELVSKKVWIISNEIKLPRLVVAQIKNKVITHYLVVLFFALIGVFTFSNLPSVSTYFFKYIVGFCGILYFILRRIINQKKIQTSYRFQFEYFYLPVVMVFVYFFIFNSSFVYANFIGLIVVADLPFILYNFYKHQQFVKKFNLA